MQLTTLLTLATAFLGTASAAAVERESQPISYPEDSPALAARDCTHGEFWHGPRPIGSVGNGCAWYVCVGGTGQLWMDCGPPGCRLLNGTPTCWFV